MTIWQQLCDALTGAGIRTYDPGAHIGACRSPYCVVQQAGVYSASSDSRGRMTYTSYYVHAYVPINSYESLAGLIDAAKEALHPLEESRVIYPTGLESAHQIDDSFAAHTAYIEYRAFCAAS